MMLAPPDPATIDRRLPEPGSWRITWRGRVWHESDITGEHLALIALITGEDDWRALDLAEIDPKRGPYRLMLMITALVAVADRADDERKLARIIRDVREATVAELLDALTTI